MTTAAAPSADEKQPLLVCSSGGGLSNYGASQREVDNGEVQSTTGNHCHDEVQQSTIDKKARRKLIIASVLCLLFMIGEIIGGSLANSLAIATDAAHLLTDLASFMISLFSLYLASRPATKRMSFGWWRAEVMGALVSVLLIWVVTGILVYMAVQRCINQNYEIDAKIMLITAGVGVAVNLVMGLTLHQGHGHSHGGSSHGHSHGVSGNHSNKSEKTVLMNGGQASQTINTDRDQIVSQPAEHSVLRMEHPEPASKEDNINVKAAFIHVLGDLVQSIGVLVAAFLIYFKGWKIADPICTFLFSVLVLGTTLTILRDTLNVLMEGAPRGINFNELKTALCGIHGVQEVHDLRLWCLTMDKVAASVHLALDKSLVVDPQQVLTEAGTIMRRQFTIYDCTIQLEDYVDEMQDCKHCQGPKK